MLMLLVSCAWIGGRTHEENLERWSLSIDEVGGDLVLCGPTLTVTGQLSAQRAGESVTLTVQLDGQTRSDDAVIGSSGSVEWSVGPFEALDAEQQTFQLTVDSTTLPWDATFAAPDGFVDLDGDGWGTTPVTSCDDTLRADVEGDCDDADADVHPGATELCTDVDENCDDDAYAGAVDTTIWYPDADGDGDGDPDGTTVEACVAPPHTAPNGDDCDDQDAAVAAPRDWYPDNDGDGAGDATEAPTTACAPPPGTVDNADDCYDDEAALTLAYDDLDGDGFGDGLAASCLGSIAPVDGDCDDGNGNVHPGADELCDALDRNCDGNPIHGAVDAPLWYLDTDGDGWGDPTLSAMECTQPLDMVANGDDCDDADNSANPDGTEVCDGIDQDCDGIPDDGVADLVELDDTATDWDTAVTTAPDGATILACGTYDWPDPGVLDGRSLTFRGGLFRGSVHPVGAALTFEHARLEGAGGIDVEGSFRGGALYLEGGTLDLIDTTFTCGGDVPSHGGAVAAYADAQVGFVRSRVSGCTATSSGGAIHAEGSTLSFIDTVLEGNTSLNNAGALGLSNTSVDVQPDGLTCVGNVAGGRGGCIRADSSSGTLDGVFDGNTASAAGAVDLRNGAFTVHGDFTGNTATSRGGALSADQFATVDFQMRWVEGNSAETGGAIDIRMGATATITGGVFTHNHADTTGGAVYTEQPLTISGATFEDNDADGDGGALWAWVGDAIAVDDSIFIANRSGRGGAVGVAPGVDVGEVQLTDVEFRENHATAGGGGLWSSGVPVVLAGTVDFLGNSSDGDGGGVLATENRVSSTTSAEQGCSNLSSVASVTTFQENSAGNNGGGLAMTAPADATSTGCTLDLGGPTVFHANQATFQGAALELLGYLGSGTPSHAVLRGDTTFTANTSATADMGAVRLHTGELAIQSVITDPALPNTSVFLRTTNPLGAGSYDAPALMEAYTCDASIVDANAACSESFNP